MTRSPLHLQIDVRVMRGPILESRHRVDAAVVRPDGSMAASAGDPAIVTTFRSAAKPFQLLPLVERGHANRHAFTDEQLAVMAASHVGSPYHVELVRGILAVIGVDEQRLACGFHEPVDPTSAAALRAHPERRSPVYNNCSGKHAGMAALCLAEGWPVDGYERAAHPLQQLMHRTVSEVCGLDPATVPVAVDGCSVSVFGMPLAAMAHGYARLAAAGASGDTRERALARIRSAMQRFPVATGGTGRFSTALMQHTGGRLVAKGGAEGLECVGVPERGLGVALKCEDGSGRGIGPACIAVLEALGVLSPAEVQAMAEHRHPAVTNHAGLHVGDIEAQVEVAAEVRS
jgi:L-asparaginase II